MVQQTLYERLGGAFAIAAVYFVLAGGWSWVKAWRAARAARARDETTLGRSE